MQWRNIMPLVHNSLSQGFFNMIVGDAKQSIYRWRNGEVEQFIQLPEVFSTDEKSELLIEQEQSLISNYDLQTLEFNFRSRENIVNFNNRFFDYLRLVKSHDFSNVYYDSFQRVGNNKEGGSVNFCSFEGEGFERADWMMQRVNDIVELCLEKGYQKKDIAIITRSNADGAAIAAQLMAKHIDVISKESLLLNSAAEVRFIIELLKFIDNPSNEICIASIKYFLQHHFDFKLLEQRKTNNATSLLTFFKENSVDFNISYLQCLPLFELCTELSILFGLHLKPNAYLKFFLDQIFGFSHHNNSIAELLTWWENKQHKFSIVVPDGVDAVNIMTIHKSKGLQFPIVILPYADLSINSRGVKHWVALNESAFPDLKFALLNHGSMLAESPFYAVKDEEERKNLLDQLNMMYVAFTRPEEHLFILSGNRRNSMHEPMFNFVKEQNYSKQTINGVNYLSLGELNTNKGLNNQDQEENEIEQTIENVSWKGLLKTSGYLPLEVAHQEQLKYGNMIHLLLSEINHPNEIDAAIIKYQDVILREKLDAVLLKNKLNNVTNLQEIKSYFNGSYLLKREASILNSQGKLLRPDLVAIKDNVASVIDYKTGEARSSYAEQITDYANLLSQMGYQIKERLLVYVDDEVVERI
jgi:ATP-dependent exoDNAse (exonuclease V) beta subunit